MNRTLKANEQQAAMIHHLKDELKIAQNTRQSHEQIAADIIGMNQNARSKNFDRKEAEMANKADEAAKTIEDLENLLIQRNDEYEIVISENEAF